MHPSSDGTIPVPPSRLERWSWRMAAGLGASLLVAAVMTLLLSRHGDRLSTVASPLLVLVLAMPWAILLGALVRNQRRQSKLLQDLQAQARLLQETRRIACIGAWTWAPDSGCVHWSEDIFHIYGQPPRTAALLVAEIADWIHPDDRDRIDGLFARLLADGEPAETEFRIVRPDGDVRSVYTRAEWVDRSVGHRVVRGIQQDITPLASVRDRLDAAQEEYAFLFEHNPLPMWVFDRQSLRFLAANTSAISSYGYSREELLELTVLDIRPPEDTPVALAAMRLDSTQHPQGKVWTHVRKDGSRLSAAIHARDVSFDGVPARLVLAVDVTERERTEQRFQLIAGATSDAVWDWDVATGALWWSDSFYTLFGHSRESTPPQIDGWEKLIHPDDRARVHASITAAVTSAADEWQESYRFRRGDGSYTDVQDRGFLLRDAAGKVIRAAGGMLDVTRQKRDEADLRLLRRAVEATDSGILIVDMRGADLPVVYANRGFEAMTGYSAAGIIGHDCRFLRSDPRDVEQRMAIRDGLRERTEVRVLLRNLRRDGSSFWNDFYMAPVRDDDGTVTHMVSVCNDVSERERNEERFQLIARATSDAVWDWDFINGTTWRSDNVFALFGYGPGEFGPNLKAWEELLHPDDRVRVMDSVNGAAASDVTEWECDYRLRRKDGSYADVRDRGFIVRDVQGRAVRALGGMLDVTQRNRDEVNLRLLRRAVEATDNGIVIADARQPDFPIVYANGAFEEITGYSAAEIIGRNCRVLQGDDKAQPGIEAVRGALCEQREARVLLRNYRKDGALFWNDFHVAPVSDENGVLSHFVGVISDVSERQRYEEQLAYRATHDELTGLPNRQLLEDRLQQAILGAERYGREAAVVFVDLDDFKLVNDSLGHGAGDIALRTVAGRLRDAVRDTDTVGRFGGDEFVIVLTEQADDRGMEDALARITAAVAQPIELAGKPHVLTPSIGYCRYPQAGSDAETLLKHADLAMYEAKRLGRNRAVAYRSELDMAVSQRLQLVSRLREALCNDEFQLAFQPLFDPSGRLLALEALARWQHPERGQLPPSEFIGVCEESGLIVDLGRFVLREAARHHALLAAVGLGKVRLSVNVSAAQFGHDLYRDVAAVMDDFALPPGVLELEITESVIMDNPERAIETMQRISALGVGISVDDFGTGYSSLAYLKRLPIDRLKIDRSFVQDLGHDADDAAICASIIGLGHLMDLRVVAEGVETEQQLAWLRERGCDELQGFLLGRPQPFAILLPQLLEPGFIELMG
jgi:diguanylate cyclase (GGDEF)-like protein/PAS domain S-box-containing protein